MARVTKFRRTSIGSSLASATDPRGGPTATYSMNVGGEKLTVSAKPRGISGSGKLRMTTQSSSTLTWSSLNRSEKQRIKEKIMSNMVNSRKNFKEIDSKNWFKG